MELTPALFEGLGMGGLVVALFWLLATGRLATRNVVDRLEHDRDEWRTESRIKDAQIQEQADQIAEKDQQLRHLAEVGRTVQSIMRALKSGPPSTGGA